MDDELSLRSTRANADDLSALPNKIVSLCFSSELELRILSRVFSDKIQEVPLWHHRDELGMRRKVRKVSNRHVSFANLPAKLAKLLMWTPQEII